MEQLKVVGVDSKGYGKVYKLVMKNPKIEPCSKALYAYLCSYAGNGTTAFPKREKIMKDLGLAKNTFTKHLGMLVEANYIARTKTSSGNVYEILTRVPDKNGDIIDIKTKGYGTVPKYAMLDKRLSATAKAVYAYFCSYAGAGNTAYPHRDTILRELGIGTTAYYKHYNNLIECGYVTPSQNTSEKGQFGATTYKLNEVLGIDPSKDPEEKPSSQKTTHGDKSHGDKKLSPSSQKAIHGRIEDVSQKIIHGNFSDSYEELSAMSQKGIHGDTVENFSRGNPSSQKVTSRQSVSRELSHPYTNNIPIINNSFSEEKEGKNNIPEPTTDGIKESRPCYTKKMVNEAICYQRLITEAIAWANLKNKLNHFDSNADKELYNKKYREIINEFAKQLYHFLGRKESVILVDNKTYTYAELRERLLSRMNFEDSCELCSDIADKYKEIRSIRQYIRRVVLNLAIQEYNNR